MIPLQLLLVFVLWITIKEKNAMLSYYLWLGAIKSWELEGQKEILVFSR
jgi:hypothetical protein